MVPIPIPICSLVGRSLTPWDKNLEGWGWRRRRKCRALWDEGIGLKTVENSIVLKSNWSSVIPFSNPFLNSSKLWNVSEATWGFPQRLESSTFSSNLIHRAVSFHSISSPCFVSSSNSTNAWNYQINNPLNNLTKQGINSHKVNTGLMYELL